MEHAGTWQDGQIVDTPIYLHYADAFADGHLPYRDVQVEYPPLAFAVILPPRLVGSSYEGYTSAFIGADGACLAVAAAAAARRRRAPRALARWPGRGGRVRRRSARRSRARCR